VEIESFVPRFKTVVVGASVSSPSLSAASVVVVVEASLVSALSVGSFEHSTGMVVVVGAEVVVVVDVVLVVLAASVVVDATVSSPPLSLDHVTTKSAAPTITIRVTSMMMS
ncbi:MAG: hypothetical protein VW037_09475, partial [Acidimicrobiaceae bacterium]